MKSNLFYFYKIKKRFVKMNKVKVLQDIMELVNKLDTSNKSDLIIDLLCMIPEDLHPKILRHLMSGEDLLSDQLIFKRDYSKI